MKPAPFEYAAPDTIDEALHLISQTDPDELKILAGGQSLMPLLNMRLARPQLLIDLSRIQGLSYIRETDGGVAIGAMTTKRDVEESALIRDRHPLFHRATELIGHPQIRNRGTVGGSFAQADPAAEYPAVALALEIEIVAHAANGTRTLAADDFFITFLTTALDPGEILTEIRVPELPASTGWSLHELSRRHGDFALVGAVATLAVSAGVCADPRVVVFGVADRAMRFPAAEALLSGQPAEQATFERAAVQVAEAIEDPISDVHGSGEYRRDLARVLTRRALEEAAGRAIGGSS